VSEHPARCAIEEIAAFVPSAEEVQPPERSPSGVLTRKWVVLSLLGQR
jgi:hypothetical protein